MPPPPVRRYTFDRVVRLIIGLVIVASLLLATAYLSDVLIPFVIAFLLAYLLNPLVERVEHCVRSRVAAILISLTLVVAVGAAGTLVLVPAIIGQGQHLFQQLHKIAQDKNLAEKVQEYLPDDWWRSCSDFLKRQDVAEWLGNPQAAAGKDAPTAPDAPQGPAQSPAVTPPDPNAVPAPNDDATPTAKKASWWDSATSFFSDPQLSGYLSSERFLGYVRAALARVAPVAASVFTGVFSGIVSIVLWLTAAVMVVLYLFFILKDYETVSSGWEGLLPPDQHDRIVSFVTDFNVYMNRYFRAQAIVAFFSAIIMAIGFVLIGLPMGILLGLFCGALSMVPYLQAVGFIPAALLALICALDTGASFWWVAGQVALVFVVAQIIYDVVLVPKFIGEAMKLSPAIILLSLSVWGKLLGLLGFLIALPMTCLLLTYYTRMIGRQATEMAPRPATKAPATAAPKDVSPAPPNDSAARPDKGKGEDHARP